MTAPSFVEPLFRAIDAMSADAFAEFLTEDGAFRFANAPAIRGREAVRDGVARFFSSIRGLEHRLAAVWEVPGVVFCEGDVTYTRHDGTTLTVPFFDVLRLGDEKIVDYRIYLDASALHGPPAP